MFHAGKKASVCPDAALAVSKVDCLKLPFWFAPAHPSAEAVPALGQALVTTVIPPCMNCADAGAVQVRAAKAKAASKRRIDNQSCRLT